MIADATDNTYYHWTLAASPRYRLCFIAIVVVFCVGLTWALPLQWLMPVIAGLLVLAVFSAHSHHALWGKQQQLQFMNGQLSVVALQKDGSRMALEVCLSGMRWLGKNTLVASYAVANANLMASVRKQAIVLTTDNSTQSDRHRLAMYYQSGLLA